MLSVSASLLIALAMILPTGQGFPDGAPIEACILAKRNSPNHPATKSQPLSTSKHSFTASGSHYRPGDIITVIINGPPFKGYFVQGRDAHTEDWIGSFEEGPETKVYPECSAATHNTVPPKTSIKLVWHAPRDRSGTVYFTGTVLERYDRYWSDMVAKVIKPRF